MRVLLVVGIVGQLLQSFSLAFLLPLLFAVLDGDSSSASYFGIGGGASFVVGRLTSYRFEVAPFVQRAEALGVVAFSWLTISFFSAIPYVLMGMSPVDAVFETMSGITTTGATILTDFSAYSRSFFLWRAVTQWFGGLGVIALFVVVLPRLGIAGRQLFFAEASSVPGEAISAKVRDGARKLWILYVVMTLVLSLLLLIFGMTPYEAVLHALTTMPAGGFSPNGASIAGYNNPTIEWILVVFMLLAGSSFTLQYRVFTGRVLGFFRDAEFIFYFSVATLGALGVAGALAQGIPSLEQVRMGAFQSASLISSTGFASVDYNLWPDSARALLLIVMLVGGCAGSAAGGPKAVRLLLVLRRSMRELTRVLHPRAVLPLVHMGRAIPDEIMRAVYALVVLFAAGHFVFGTVLVLFGADLITGYSAALACLGNIGPGFGPAGPMGSFAGFPVISKITLTFAMWIGRLEIVTVVALMHPDVWRNLRLSRS